MSFKLYDIIAIIVILQCSLFTLVLLSNKKKKVTSNKMLALFLAAQIIGVLNGLILSMHHYFHPHLYYLGFPIIYLWGPTLYHYVKSVTIPDFKLSVKSLLHLIPAITVFLFLLFNFYHKPVAEKYQLIISNRAVVLQYSKLFLFLLHLQISIYVVLSYGEVRQFRQQLKNNFSSISKINLKWLTLFLYGYLFAWFYVALINFYPKILPDVLSHYPNEFKLGLFLIFFNVIFYKGYNQPEIWHTSTVAGKKEKYKTTGLENDGYHHIREQLSEYMQNERAYLRPKITLTEISKELAISYHHLSQVINDSFNKKFFDYINHYRIEEIKRLMADPQHEDKTILQLLYMAGFNSKSTFNRAFRKATGMSPMQYKKSIIDS